MPRALKVCSTNGCPELTAGGRCDECKAKAEQIRGRARQRGYNGRWEARRRAFLRRPENLFCVLCQAPSTVADHYPLSRRELLAQGVTDPDADHRLRPLCGPCHSKATAATPSQRGGWNAR